MTYNFKGVCYFMLNKIFLEDNCQSSAELILLIGGILIIVLLLLNFYRNYLNDVSENIDSKEINDFNNSIEDIKFRFNKIV